jgi:hypothetical protein
MVMNIILFSVSITSGASGTPQQILDFAKFGVPQVLPPKEPFTFFTSEPTKSTRPQLGLKNSLCFDSMNELRVKIIIPAVGCPAP